MLNVLQYKFFRLQNVYPAMFNHTNHGVFEPAITASHQAIFQLIASIVTLVVALVGGALTGIKNLFVLEGKLL